MNPVEKAQCLPSYRPTASSSVIPSPETRPHGAAVGVVIDVGDEHTTEIICRLRRDAYGLALFVIWHSRFIVHLHDGAVRLWVNVGQATRRVESFICTNEPSLCLSEPYSTL